jgi:hypothetical protein
MAGFSAGFYYLKGRTADDSVIAETEYGYLVPFQLQIGYRYVISDDLFFVPYLFGGGGWLYMPYNDSGVKQELSDFGPVAGAGAEFGRVLRQNYSLALGFEIGCLVKNNITENIYSRIELRAAYRF